MRIYRFRWWWVFGNLLWFVLVPAVFAIWLSREVDAQYAAGTRINTHSDSLSLPVGFVFLMNTVAMAVANLILGVVLLVRKARAARSLRRRGA